MSNEDNSVNIEHSGDSPTKNYKVFIRHVKSQVKEKQDVVLNKY